MSNLSIPNTVANGISADGNEVGANFNAVQDWADDHVVEVGNETLMPTGAVVPFAAASAPAGYLLCDGTAYSRATYADLFALIGTTYGAGDSSTTFNVPNLKSRFPVGYDAADSAHNALGETGGSQDAITVAHTHAVDPPSTSVSINDPGHQHGVNVRQNNWKNGTSGTVQNYADYLADNTAVATTGITASVDIASFTSGSTGSSGTDANLPPYLTMNFIIKT